MKHPPARTGGWRIEVETAVAPSLVIRMTNISPEGQETLAVLAEYARPPE